MSTFPPPEWDLASSYKQNLTSQGAPTKDSKYQSYSDGNAISSQSWTNKDDAPSVPEKGFNMLHTPTGSLRPSTDGDRPSTVPERAAAAEHEKLNELPTVVFAIPFPPPVGKPPSDSSAPFLLYTLPRAIYQKPPKGGDGKPGKEKLIKKIERKWQDEVEEGENIKRDDVKEATTWQKFKGGAARTASGVIKWMPNSVIEALARLPPGKKMGPINVIYSEAPYSQLPNCQTFTREEMDERLKGLLVRTKKEAYRNQIISGLMLPVTAAIDFLVVVPIFAFEINAAYFASQLGGSRKVSQLTSEDSLRSLTYTPTSSPETFAPIFALLYDYCTRLAPTKFPVLDDKRYPDAGKAAVTGLIEEFKAVLPKEVWERHVLDGERVAEDLGRCLQKGAKEYVKSL